MKDIALQSGLDYVFGFFERGHRRQAGRYDREVRRPDVFAAIAAEHRILPSPRRTVLITGSKGKGSCARLIAAYLQQQGKKVGLVLTPEERHHLDRIRIDGEAIGADDFLRLLDSFKSALDATADTVSGTYYHPPTAIFLLIALKHFRERDVDYIVIEGGRGAQYDEIGRLQAAVGIVTSILPEHLNKLGPTLREICIDKFSLAHHCDTLVCSAQARALAQSQAITLDEGKVRVAEVSASTKTKHPVWLDTADGLARCAMRALGVTPGLFPDDENVLASCQVITADSSPALRGGQAVFLDGAVAADCLDFDYIRSDGCAPKAIVFGMSADKDAQAIAQTFAAQGYGRQYFFEAVSRTKHVAPLSFIERWSGRFDTEYGLDEASRYALLKLIEEHGRIYVVGVQIFLRSVRNALA
jgi:folylpolyglutamate synthase/dihydropteroate synthase